MTYLLPPSPRDQVRQILQRISALEARRLPTTAQESTTSSGPNGPHSAPQIVFTYPGPLAPNIESPPYYPPVDIGLSQARVSLLANATVDTAIDFRVNGISVATLTLPAGSKTILISISQLVLQTDYATVHLGSGADSNLTVELF